MVYCSHTAISRKVVGKIACGNPDRYCGWFWFCSWKKFERMVREAMEMCLRVLSSLFFKEIWKNGTRGHGHVFVSAKGKQQKKFWQLQCQEQCIDHIPYYLSGLLWRIFSDNLSQNSCIPNMVSPCWLRRISQGDWRQSETAKYFEWTIYRINLYVQVRNELIKQTLQLINCAFWIIFQICYFQIWQTLSPHRYQSDICTPAPRSP